MANLDNGKGDTFHVESSPPPNHKLGESSSKHADLAADLVTSGQRPVLTEADSKRIRRKTDKTILIILIWVYFLQILDKSVLGYGATFGLQTDTGLTGNQYSLVGSIAPIAQLAWQPFSSYLIVRVPHRILMPTLCLGWGIAQACMAACHNFQTLMAARFFLGLFEAGCLPLFSVITSQWYRRAEQPVRVAWWYGTNGLATIVAAGLSDGLAHIKSDVLKPWQIIFLFVGCLTIASVPFIYWKLDNDIPSARFLTEEEKPMAVERLRANQTGTGSRDFKLKHVFEALIEPKTWLWIGMSMLLNVGASVTNTFGPLILSGLGFDAYTTSLLNMPFGAMQLLVIILASYLAQKARVKGAILAMIMLPVVAGLAVLYAVPRSGHQAALLVGYYLLAFLFGGNPLIVTWIVGNTAGTTKKSFVMSAYNAASSAGNIVGPLLFNKKDSPAYHPGLRGCLGIFVALVAIILLQWANLVFLNKLQERKRVRNGKPAKMVDHSMQNQYHDFEEDNADAIVETGMAEHTVAASEGELHERVGQQAFLDLTDRQNDELHASRSGLNRGNAWQEERVMDPASPRDVTSPPKQNTLNAALRQEQEVNVHKDSEEQAAQVIQRFYRGHRTRRELKGWSLNSSARWLEAVKDAQWHQAMQGQYPTGQEGNNEHQNHETDLFANQVEESEQTRHQSSSSLSPDVRKKWKFAGKVALRAGGDDNAQDKVAETVASSSSETQVSEAKLSGQKTTTTTSSQTFLSRTQRQSTRDVEKTAKTMDLQYFLEMVDTKHRYGSNLRAYHSVWKNGPSKQNFFYWLDYGDGKDFEIERVPRDRLEREQVRYLTREERQNYLVLVDKNGRFRWAKNDERVWTDSEQYKDSMKGVVPINERVPTFREHTAEGDEIFTESSSDSDNLSGSDEEDSDEEVRRYVNPDFENAKGIKKVQYVSPAVIFNQLMEKSLKKKDKWIFVADTSYRIYISIKESGAFQHSSFLRGARISAAGLIKIKNGQLRRLSPLSGHYRPPAANFRAFVHALQQQGVDMSRVSISRSYAVLVGIEGYMKFKQKKKDVKDKLDEEKFKALNISDNTENPSRRTTQNDEISSVATDSAQTRDEESSRKPSFITGLVKTLSRKDSQPQGQAVDIRGREIPGTAPEEGVPAPVGHR